MKEAQTENDNEMAKIIIANKSGTYFIKMKNISLPNILQV